ncbi:MAG TPA: RNA methyltransferase [Sandaracinaceae bacterium LLY-WYZ-13_1]|nr:RNA methyltransferase [Sandaracinaceae bacterium LLY-WYZ-13_1]
MSERHPRDRFLTVYGRKPVLEVLEAPERAVARVFVAKGARGPMVKRILAAAKGRGVEVQRVSGERVSRISRRPKQDQGVAADVEAPSMGPVEAFLDALDDDVPATLLALDHVTTPANVGMILRTATVLGLAGVILPRRGVPEVGPLVIKASAGVAFRARILRCGELVDALSAAKMRGFEVVGLSDAGDASIGGWTPRARTVLVLGNETDGVSSATRPLVDAWLRIPMAQPGDSLNVASAAAIVAWVAAAAKG